MGFAASFWLSLAIIFINALAPSAAPWRESHGSAFNGFTRDVSLGPSRSAPVEKDQKIRDRRHQQPAHGVAPSVAAVSLSSPVVVLRPVDRGEVFAAMSAAAPNAPSIFRLRARGPPTA